MNAPRTSGWQRIPGEAIGSALVALGGLGYFLRYFNRGTNLLDEGSQAAQALRILHGDLIYRDFVTVVAPGSYYTVAGLFALFGTDLMVLRWAVVVLGVGILLVTLAVARHLMPWPFAAASALLTTVWGWFVVTPNFYTWQAMFFALLALLCYLRSARTSSTRWVLCAGLAAGATVLTKQNVGVFAAAALLLTIWLSPVFETNTTPRSSQRRRTVIRFIGGICIPVVPVLLSLVLAGAGPDLYENLVHYPQENYPRGLGLAYPAFFPLSLRALLAGDIPERGVYELWTKCVLYLPVVVYPFAIVALTTLWFHRRKGRVGQEAHTLLAITLFGALTFLQAFPRSDDTHIVFGMQPGFVLLGYLSFCLWRGLAYIPALLRRRIVSGRLLLCVEGVVLAVALLPQAGLLWNGYKRTDSEFQNNYVPLRAERARGILAHPDEARRIDQVTQYITAHTAPREPIFVVPWAAGFYFLTDRPNPTRVDLFLYEDPKIYPCLIADLDKSQPRYVIYGYVWDVDGNRFRDYARPIDAYIRTRYRVEATLAEYEIWRRLDGQTPAFENGSAECERRASNARSLGRILRSFWRSLSEK